MSISPTDLADMDQELKTACWITDLMVAALPDLLAFSQAAAAWDPKLAEEANRATDGIKGFAAAIGMLRHALTELRLRVPDGEDAGK